MYERGTAVELGADQEGDPLAFERSRVAVYLEGRFPAEASAVIADDTPIVKMEQTNRRFSPETLVIRGGRESIVPQPRSDLS